MSNEPGAFETAAQVETLLAHIDELEAALAEIERLREQIVELKTNHARIYEAWEWVSSNFLNLTHYGGHLLIQMTDAEFQGFGRFLRAPTQANLEELEKLCDSEDSKGPLDLQHQAVAKLSDYITELERIINDANTGDRMAARESDHA